MPSRVIASFDHLQCYVYCAVVCVCTVHCVIKKTGENVIATTLKNNEIERVKWWDTCATLVELDLYVMCLCAAVMNYICCLCRASPSRVPVIQPPNYAVFYARPIQTHAVDRTARHGLPISSAWHVHISICLRTITGLVSSNFILWLIVAQFARRERQCWNTYSCACTCTCTRTCRSTLCATHAVLYERTYMYVLVTARWTNLLSSFAAACVPGEKLFAVL